jgi:DnaK suppressor protein
VAKPAPKPPAGAKRSAKPAARSKVTKVAKTAKPVGRSVAKPAAKPLAKAKLPLRRSGTRKATLASKPKPVKRKPQSSKVPVKSKGRPAPAAAKAARPSSAIAVAKPVAKPRPTPVARPTTPSPRPTPAHPAPGSVATPPKPKRNGSGLGSRDLQHFADLLLVKRREIVGDMHSMEGEALRSGGSGLSTLPVHMADMGTDNYEQEFTLGLVEKDRTLLREINHALAKIPDGTFGICEGTGLPIGKPRLEQVPWARYSIEHARQRERNGRGVRVFF